jgi:hypothetical protein
VRSAIGLPEKNKIANQAFVGARAFLLRQVAVWLHLVHALMPPGWSVKNITILHGALFPRSANSPSLFLYENAPALGFLSRICAGF